MATHPTLTCYNCKIDKKLAQFLESKFKYVWGYITRQNSIILKKFNIDSPFEKNFYFIHYCYSETLKRYLILSQKDMCLAEVADECLGLIESPDAQVEIMGKNTNILIRKKEINNYFN